VILGGRHQTAETVNQNANSVAVELGVFERLGGCEHFEFGHRRHVRDRFETFAASSQVAHQFTPELLFLRQIFNLTNDKFCARLVFGQFRAVFFDGYYCLCSKVVEQFAKRRHSCGGCDAAGWRCAQSKQLGTARVIQGQVTGHLDESPIRVVLVTMMYLVEHNETIIRPPSCVPLQ
jgi:hypothetical protein